MTALNHDTKFPAVAYVVIAVLHWSTGGLFIKLTTLDAYQVTFFRSLLAGVTVAILTRKQGLRINLFGVLTSLIYATLLFLFVWATKKTTAANAIFLQYTAPIYILILAPFVCGHTKATNGRALWRVTQFRIAAKIAYKNHLVEGHEGPLNCFEFWKLERHPTRRTCGGQADDSTVSVSADAKILVSRLAYSFC